MLSWPQLAISQQVTATLLLSSNVEEIITELISMLQVNTTLKVKSVFAMFFYPFYVDKTTSVTSCLLPA